MSEWEAPSLPPLFVSVPPQYSAGYHERYVRADLSGSRPGEGQPGTAGGDDTDRGDSLWHPEDGQQEVPQCELLCCEEGTLVKRGAGAEGGYRLHLVGLLGLKNNLDRPKWGSRSVIFTTC